MTSYPEYQPPTDWESTGDAWKDAALEMEHLMNYWKLRALRQEEEASRLREWLRRAMPTIMHGWHRNTTHAPGMDCWPCQASRAVELDSEDDL